MHFTLESQAYVMLSVVLYLLIVLIWGTTWFAAKFQLTQAPIEVSVFYRFSLAAIVLIGFCRAKGMTFRFPWKEHIIFFLMGICLFSFHVVLSYRANCYLVSGCVSVLFSMVSVFNVINAFIFLHSRPTRKTGMGIACGVLGIIAFFWKDLISLSSQGEILIGIAYGLGGSLLFSFGNVLSSYRPRAGGQLLSRSALSMCYGCLSLFIYCLVNQISFTVPLSLTYWGAVSYLGLFATLIGFLGYLDLVARLGPQRAGYATLLFPIVALMLSSVVENYTLYFNHFLGIGFVALGNFLVMPRKKPVLLLGVDQKEAEVPITVEVQEEPVQEEEEKVLSRN